MSDSRRELHNHFKHLEQELQETHESHCMQSDYINLVEQELKEVNDARFQLYDRANYLDEELKKADQSHLELHNHVHFLDTELKEANMTRLELRENVNLMQQELKEANESRSNLQDHVHFMELEVKKSNESCSELELKYATIMEYSQEREMDLLIKLEKSEQARKKFEIYVNEAENKELAITEERRKAKEQIDQLRQEMKDLELSYLKKINSHAKRASDVTVSK